MSVTRRGKTWAVGLFAGALIGGGIALVTPAGAAVQGAAAAIDWKQIWQTKIKPRTDKRYYTKKKANARYYTKWDANAFFESKAAHDASLANYYTKAQHDASLLNYYTKTQSDANYYSKAASDAKYAPSTLIRGAYGIEGQSAIEMADGISFGVTLSAAPTPHFIRIGDPIPANCSGTVTAPNAAPGHLCIFEGTSGNAGPGSFGPPTGGSGTSGTMGGFVFVSATTVPGLTWSIGSWAVRPVALAPTAFSPAAPGAVNQGQPGTGGSASR